MCLLARAGSVTLLPVMLTTTQRETHSHLGIPADYGAGGLPRFYAEAVDLADAGPNLVGRPQTLVPLALERWQAMARRATEDGITLLIVSGFRSFEYQASLIEKKLSAGQDIKDILAVNAAPGFSEHHTGAAIDIASPGCRPLTEEFEASPAFGWLSKRAGDFGFRLSYPRDNASGFVYEPWHWALEEVVSA